MPPNARKQAPGADDDWTFLRCAARTLAYRIERAPDGGPVRDIAEAPGKKPMGYVESAKAGRSQPWDRYVQRSRYWQCEADPAVANYLAQPLKLLLRADGDEFEFHPDVLLRYRDGRVECERLTSSRHPSEKEKRLLGFARDALAAEATPLREVNARDVLGTARERNSIKIHGDRWTRMSADVHSIAAAVFDRLGALPPTARRSSPSAGPGSAGLACMR
jgi:hypothetical protein